jgi:hypothetical protein
LLTFDDENDPREAGDAEAVGRSSTTVAAAFGGAPASGIAPTEMVDVGLPPPRGELALEASARWMDSGGLLGDGN